VTSLLYQTLQQQQQQFKPFKINNMSTCSNCYNGCTEIVSDRCVKYTGIDVPVLGIQTGDSLSFVEQALITFLTSTIDGTGVIIDLSSINICAIVQSYLPTCGDISIADISKALIQAACDLQEEVNTLTSVVTDIEAPYTTECLTVVPGNSLTHQVVQAVIDKVCALNDSFSALVASLPNTYVPINSSPGHPGVNDYIEDYINTQSTILLAQGRMIPYTAVPYFGPLSNYPAVGDSFDINGAGSGYWAKVYLCNGVVAPDLRGRTLVGATTGMGGGAFNAAVDPAITGNPNYNLTTVYGENIVTLGIGQIPSHTHTNTAVSTATPHNHNTIAKAGPAVVHSSSSAFLNGGNTWSNTGTSDTRNAGIENSTVIVNTVVTNNPIGGGGSHNNVQPSRGCYYIMYIP